MEIDRWFKLTRYKTSSESNNEVFITNIQYRVGNNYLFEKNYS